MTNYLSFNQLQAKLGNCSRSSAYRYLENGRIPQPIKLGARLLWPEDAIDAALADLSK